MATEWPAGRILNIGEAARAPGFTDLIRSSMFMSDVPNLGQFNCTPRQHHLLLPRLGRDLTTGEIEDTNQETMSSHAGSEPLCHPAHHQPTHGKLIKILARIVSLSQSRYFYHLLQSHKQFHIHTSSHSLELSRAYSQG